MKTSEEVKVTPEYPVNLRSGPDIGSPLIFCGPKRLHYLMPGKKAKELEVKGEWMHVEVYGEKAWCLAKYMQRV